MTCSALSISHFCARSSTRPRPSKPNASQPGCAARPRAAISVTASAPRSGMVATVSPVAGFSTGMSSPACATPLWVWGKSWTICESSAVAICVSPARSLVANKTTPTERLGSEFDRGDADRLRGPVGAVGGDTLQLVHDVDPVLDLSEHGVLAVQPRTGVGGDDEELRPVRVRPGVRHRQRPADDLVGVDLVLEGVPGAAGARPLRTAALDHEVLDHPVKGEPVIEPLRGELAEVLDGLRRVFVEQLEDDRAFGGLHRGSRHERNTSAPEPA